MRDTRNKTLFAWSLIAILIQIIFLSLNALNFWRPSLEITMISLGIIATYATQNRLVNWNKEENKITKRKGHAFAYIFWGYAILINILHYGFGSIWGLKIEMPVYLIETFWGVTGVFFGTELMRIFNINNSINNFKKDDANAGVS